MSNTRSLDERSLDGQWEGAMNKLIAMLLIVTGCSLCQTALAKPWHVHNQVNQTFSVLWIAKGCAKIKYCGASGNNHGYVCKKQKVEANEEATYKWGASGKSDKKIVICTTDGLQWSSSTHHQTYICPTSGKAPYSNWTLAGGSCP
jgi:hypothetical protein